MPDIPKTYDPTTVEPKWYRFWEENDLFRTDPDSGKPPYCIMMPPPNITGELHMGHGLQDSLQDMLIRMKRMQGFEALWQPGTDHAGIATQNVVEKSLAKEGVTRHQLGREEFIKKVWEWRQRFGDRILQQKRLLGDSADWHRERFTFDPGLSAAVSKVFVHLYEKGLIYRGNYIVNWCPRCHTAISDEEVDHKDEATHLWHFRYPLVEQTPPPPPPASGGEQGGVFVTVATTRPETMLGDTAIAINPNDERMTHLRGRKVRLPLVGREIPIIEDEFVDPAFGTGQVKVTPAHDPNDFEMGKRHSLAQVIVMDEKGVMNHNAGQFKGLDRFKAREAIVAAMDEQGLLDRIEDYTTSIGHCSRCRTVIEPYLSLQWFVKMKPLAEPALAAVRDGRIKFYPGRWEKVYYSWLENVRDWCISRQLWWGHRIPVWYCQACGEVIVRTDAPDVCPKCKSSSLKQDEDVLDTWFSSWLWPFSTLGWPEKTRELEFWYPTQLLVSGYDIIFFWIARMIMAGIEFIGDIPYSDVFITGMIKDEQGRWMSKSLGNGIDPAEMVKQYGADAVRFTMVTLATEGQDIKLSPSRFEGGRNFANKLWNAYRFLIGHVERLLPESRAQIGKYPITDMPPDAPLADRWIVSRLAATIEQVHTAADKYRLFECLNAQYDFLWKEFCDWYLELIKNRLTPETPEQDRQFTLEVALLVFESSMRLLHPAMPFITEEIWQGMKEHAGPKVVGYSEKLSIMTSHFPKPGEYPRDEKAEREMAIGRIEPVIVHREVTAAHSIPRNQWAEQITISGMVDPSIRPILEKNKTELLRATNSGSLEFSAYPPSNSISGSTSYYTVSFTFGNLDHNLERSRLDKEIERLESAVRSLQTRLANSIFTEKAPPQVVLGEKTRLQEYETLLKDTKMKRETLL